MMRNLHRFWLVPTLVLAAWLAACGSENGDITGEAAQATVLPAAESPSLLPTPTLVPELADITRPPPTPQRTPTPAPPTATPTNTPTPTPTPLPSERVELGQTSLAHGDFAEAVDHFRVALEYEEVLDEAQQGAAARGLGEAYLRQRLYTETVAALNTYLSLPAIEAEGEEGEEVARPERSAPAALDDEQAVAVFHLAEAQANLGDCVPAIAAYELYLQANSELTAYVQPRIATCRLEMGEREAAVTALETALGGGAHRLREIETRQTLADFYLEDGDYMAAVAQYDAIHDLAQTEEARGQMTYLAGEAALQAGDEEAAYERFRFGVENYPRAYGTYLGLVILVGAGEEVDAFRRGLIDYYAQAYAPAVAAFNAYLDAAPDEVRADAHLYLAWSYEGLGDLASAEAHLDAYAALGATEDDAPHAAEALVEKGKLYARAGQAEAAIASYLEAVEGYPEAEEAPFALWSAAVLVQGRGDVERAMALYRQLAADYPRYEEAAYALYRAGRLAWTSGDEEGAQAAWQRLADQFPEDEYGAAGLVWLLKTAPPAEMERYVITATEPLSDVTYYGLRAQEVALGMDPFRPPPTLNLAADEGSERAAAEAWLVSWLELEDGEARGRLDPELADSGWRVRGEKLWRLGLFAEGKRELEALRTAYKDDALASYQLALYFRELGIYRSSILAAESILRLAGETVFQAPRLIGRLAYPVYYRDLIVPLAERYGYDPLLQFALVRQESLFESFIASPVGAQGLSQVMPATGEDIARRLNWPDYSGEQLYRPHVGLAFGAFYLDEQLGFFDGNVYAALSAYNAGPGNAARWYADAPDDRDRYLEIVDYRETRLYIKRIYIGYAIYRHLYGGR